MLTAYSTNSSTRGNQAPRTRLCLAQVGGTEGDFTGLPLLKDTIKKGFGSGSPVLLRACFGQGYDAMSFSREV